ncbi:MAG: hypothetical protein WA705_09145 [Candidatus Ozemobacteraceae bacterium]
MRFKSLRIFFLVLAFGFSLSAMAQATQFSAWFDVDLKIYDIKTGVSISGIMSGYGVKRLTGDILSMRNIQDPVTYVSEPDLNAAKYLKSNSKELDFLVASQMQTMFAEILAPFVGVKGSIAKAKGKFSIVKIKGRIVVEKDHYGDFHVYLTKIYNSEGMKE